MKKIYLLTMMIAAGTVSFAQLSQSAIKKSTALKKQSTEFNFTEKAPGVTLWDDTFNDPANWVIGGDGSQGEWVIGNVGDLDNSPGYFAAISSTTVSDGFAFFEGIGYLLDDAVQPQNAWIEMSNSIDLSTEEYVNFSFEQQYRAFGPNRTYVEVSLDGGVTWGGTIDVNPDVQHNTATSVDINERFTVNNSNDVKFRFRWQSTNSGYAWQVDDVKISTVPDNDVRTSTLYYGSNGLPYYQIPEAQIVPIDMSVNVTNVGLNDQKGIQFAAEETIDGNFSGVSPSVDLDFDESDSLVLSTSFTPPGLGNYRVEFSILNDSVDDNPTNNNLNDYEFEVGNFIYARDNGVVDGVISGDLYQAQPILEPATFYDINQNADLTGIDVVFGASQDEGIEVFGRVYESTPDGYEFVSGGETEIYTTQNGDEGSKVTLVFTSPLAVEAGKTYLVSVGAFTHELFVATGGESVNSSLVYGDLGGGTGWYLEPNTPMIRMNFDPSLSIESNEESSLIVSQNFPNPFSDRTTVEYTLENASKVSYTLVDLTGKSILEVNEGNVSAGKHEITIDGASLANGVYYFNMSAGNTQVTHKMIVNK